MNDSRLTELLGLRVPPVAVKFAGQAPNNIPRVNEAATSGCTYWKLAAEGRTFYTEAADHYGCPVGSHTHGIDLPERVANELQGLVSTMVQLEYMRLDEVPGIPRLAAPFGVAMYAPLSSANFEPDVVIISGNVKQLMLVSEAAHAAGVQFESSTIGRPTCAAIPAVIRSGGATTNLGCIGNRVYTGLPDDAFYFIVAFPCLGAIENKLQTIVRANQELEKFHRARVA